VGAAVVGLIAAVVGAVIGSVGGYLTARQQGRQALALAEVAAARERERRQLAVDIARLEIEKDPKSPHMAAEHVAVLMHLLEDLDVELASESERAAGVERFREAFCASCGPGSAVGGQMMRSFRGCVLG
jgi:gas vesicle protein